MWVHVQTKHTQCTKSVGLAIDIQQGQPLLSLVFSVPTPNHCVVALGHLSAKWPSEENSALPAPDPNGNK